MQQTDTQSNYHGDYSTECYQSFKLPPFQKLLIQSLLNVFFLLHFILMLSLFYA